MPYGILFYKVLVKEDRSSLLPNLKIKDLVIVL